MINPIHTLWDLKEKMREEIASACKPIEEAIRAKYAPLIAQAEKLRDEDEQSLQEKQMRQALDDAIFPLGTKLYEWTNRESLGYTYRYVPWKKTGRVGFFDIYDERTQAPIKLFVRHAKPFIRLAKKDGTPGKKSSCRFGPHWPNWLPEGEHPDNYKHPAKERG